MRVPADRISFREFFRAKPAKAPSEAVADRAQRVELILRLPDGQPWSLTFSAGMEIFIGHYPRLEGFGPDDMLLAFHRVAPTA